MIVRSYTGRTVAEALAKVKNDLGDAALIIETRPVKTPGLFGTKAGYEVVAARDDAATSAARRATAVGTRSEAVTRSAAAVLARDHAERRASVEQEAERDQASGLRERQVVAERERLDRELGLIRAQLARLATGSRAPVARLGAWAEALTAAELPEDLLAELDGALAAAGDRLDPTLTRDFLARWLARGLPVAPLAWDDVHCLMVVGPTGVGKTTTIAKLAGDLVLNRKRKVAIATIDTYRVGATDQLRAYAVLLDVPLEIAQTPAQLGAIIQGFADYDHVLVDTAGRSPADTARVHELKGFCRAVPTSGAGRVAVMLAIAATCGRAEFAAVVERFSILPLEHVAVTKLDECAAPGRLYGCLRRHQLAPAWFTTGQEVPSDIAVATADALVDRLFAAAAVAA